MTSFGLSGLPVFHAGHLSWQRPHSVQRQRLQQLLLVEVLDLADADDGVLVLHQRLEVGRRTERAERLGLTLHRRVERRGEDVHVLAVEHEDQEAHDDGDLRDDEDRLERQSSWA